MKQPRIVWFFLWMFPLTLGSSKALAYQSPYSMNYVIPEHQSGFGSEEYEVKVSSKFQRGLQNFFLGWLEVPHGVKSEMYYRKQEQLSSGVETFFIGLFRGMMNGIGRTGVGLYEAFTSPYPQGPILEEMDQWLY